MPRETGGEHLKAFNHTADDSMVVEKEICRGNQPSRLFCFVSTLVEAVDVEVGILSAD